MIDIKFLREHPDKVKLAAKHKNAKISAAEIDKVLKLDDKKRELLTQTEEMRRKRNALSDAIGKTKPTDQQIAAGKSIRTKIAAMEADLAAVDAEFEALFKLIPNIPTADVPVGATEDENVVIRRVGDVPQFTFVPKNHWQLAEPLGLIDKGRAAKVAGARFAYIKGSLVKLQLAILNWSIGVLTDESILKSIIAEHKLSVASTPFIPVLPPLMIRTGLYDAMDRLEPTDDRYKIESDDLWMQGSAEHVLGSMHAGEMFAAAQLPLRYAGYATSFRREAGTYGKDMEGIFRMHQFDKLEMESFTLPEQGMDEHLLLIAIQEYFMQQLEIPYQVLMKCTADIGKPNARGVDVETWLPGQNKYRESHTADYMTDYQTRRLGIRVKLPTGETVLAHTNDATGLAMGRTMIAILENYQEENGTIRIPNVLRPYYGKETL